MKKILSKLIYPAVILILIFSLTACTSVLEKLPFKIPGLSDKDDDNTNENETLVLIENKVAKFQLVFTSKAGPESIKRAESLVKQLRSLGVQISDPVSEGDKDKMTDCEIIIGPEAKYRGDEFAISEKELGKDGQIIKIFGSKILIAGGTQKLTYSLFDSYITKEMNITKNTETIENLSVNSLYSVNVYTSYRIDSITVSGTDLKDYTLVYDTSGLGDFAANSLKSDFLNKIYEISGIIISEGDIDKLNEYGHAFIIRYSSNSGDKGFRVYVEGNNLIAETSYPNALERSFGEFAEKTFYGNTSKTISIGSDFKYEKDVTVATYQEFGAKGDGKTCDFAAILAAHEYANAGGQKVLGSAGATYYISPEKFTSSIPIKTNVDFRGASFIVDDRGEDAFANRKLTLFSLSPDEAPVTFSVGTTSEDIKNNALEFNGEKVSIASETSEQLDWLTPHLKTKSMVIIINKNHMDYIRYGGNQNSGRERHEVLLVDTDGTIDESTPVFFDYDKLTDIIIYRCDDKPLTIENGTFYTICASAALVNRGGITEYKVFARGFGISRANVTIKKLNHAIADQPDVLSNMDNSNGSYPYEGFLTIRDSYNLSVEDCELAGHLTYYEKTSSTATSGGSGEYNYTAAGSYDFIVNRSTHISFKGLTQKNMPYTLDASNKITEAPNAKSLCNEENYFDIGNNKYWGIMCSSFSRNLKFDKCYISRIDAHEGFFNIDVKNTYIGHTFNAIGGGYINLDGMTRIAGNSYIVTRSDYGGSFKGTVTIKNGALLGHQMYNTGIWYTGVKYFDKNIYYTEAFLLNTEYMQESANRTDLERYWNWNFGYDCYMPKTLTLEGTFTVPEQIKVYISAKDYDDYFENFVPAQTSDYHAYALIEEIIYKDWSSAEFEINRNSAKVGLYENYSSSNKTKGDYMASNCDIIRINTES